MGALLICFDKGLETINKAAIEKLKLASNAEELAGVVKGKNTNSGKALNKAAAVSKILDPVGKLISGVGVVYNTGKEYHKSKEAGATTLDATADAGARTTGTIVELGAAHTAGLTAVAIATPLAIGIASPTGPGAVVAAVVTPPIAYLFGSSTVVFSGVGTWINNVTTEGIQFTSDYMNNVDGNSYKTLNDAQNKFDDLVDWWNE